MTRVGRVWPSSAVVTNAARCTSDPSHSTASGFDARHRDLELAPRADQHRHVERAVLARAHEGLALDEQHRVGAVVLDEERRDRRPVFEFAHGEEVHGVGLRAGEVVRCRRRGGEHGEQGETAADDGVLHEQIE